MTRVLVLSTTFDFSGTGVGDEENFATLELSQVTDWLDAVDDEDKFDEDKFDELGEVIEAVCRFATMSDMEDFKQLSADLKAGKMLKLESEQTQVVFAPVVAEDGESEEAAFKRTRKVASAAMSEMCDFESDHPWD